MVTRSGWVAGKYGWPESTLPSLNDDTVTTAVRCSENVFEFAIFALVESGELHVRRPYANLGPPEEAEAGVNLSRERT
jgi:hypothetical protein